MSLPLRLLAPNALLLLVFEGAGENVLLIFILPGPLLLQIQLQGSVTGALSTEK